MGGAIVWLPNCSKDDGRRGNCMRGGGKEEELRGSVEERGIGREGERGRGRVWEESKRMSFLHTGYYGMSY